jgi:sialic acid synthase
VRELVIDGRRIHDEGDAYVVAEIGHNHQGSLEKAHELMIVAKSCGVDAVKFQKRENRVLFTRVFYDSPYDNENSFGPTYGAHREALEFDRDGWIELRGFARELGVAFIAAPFDPPSADLLGELDIDAFKFASGDLLNLPLIRQVASFGKPILLSTGGGTLEDIERAVDTILALNSQLCVLHCTASYPAEVEDLNLRVITSLRERFPELVIGFSDHHNGIAMSVVAYMLGARVFEKHFTLNHAWKGSDHALSLMPEGMRKMVRDLRRAPVALGDGVKLRLPSEEPALRKMGKKLVAARDLPAGHLLEPGDLEAKSPADGGLPPYELDRLLGRRLLRPLANEEDVTFEDVEQAHELAAHRSQEA